MVRTVSKIKHKDTLTLVLSLLGQGVGATGPQFTILRMFQMLFVHCHVTSDGSRC